MDLGKGEKMPASKTLAVGQRLEIFTYNGEIGYKSRIEDITKDRLMVAMPTDEKGFTIIPSLGERLLCRATTTATSYVFFANYLDKGRSPIPVLFLTKPETVEKMQKREFVRVQVNRSIVIRPVDEEGALGDMVLTTTVDLSGGGVGIINDFPLPLDSMVAIEMANIPGIELLKLMGRVVRCVPVDSGGKKRYRIGLRFLEFSRGDQNKMIRYIFDVQRKILAKGIGK